MAIVVNRKKPAVVTPLPTPPAPVERVVQPQIDQTIIKDALKAQQTSLEQMTKANDAFIAALRHEFAKQNYKSLTATVERDKQGKISKIHMEVERP